MNRNAFLAILLFTVIGCGGTNIGLRGTVTYSDDNSPVPNGMIIFNSSTKPYTARAEIKDGKWIASSVGANDGLPADSYKVSFTGVQKSIGEKDGMEQFEPLIDEKYSAAATSGVTLTVDSATKTQDFKLDRFVKK